MQFLIADPDTAVLLRFVKPRELLALRLKRLDRLAEHPRAPPGPPDDGRERVVLDGPKAQVLATGKGPFVDPKLLRRYAYPFMGTIDAKLVALDAKSTELAGKPI